MKTLWEMIKSFFYSLFGVKTDLVAVEDVPSQPKEDEEDKSEVGLDRVEVTVYNNTNDIGKVDETSTNESLTFDESDKEAICNILRPIIKSLNSDDFYAAVCASLTQTKLLKTFSTLSEDKKTLTIRLTQNKFFNAELTEFISGHVVSLFKSSIDAEFLGKYELTADGGSVIITKVG